MNQIKKTGVMLSLLLALVVGWASVATAAVAVEGDAYVGVFDKYLWRGFDLSGGQPVAQGGTDLSIGGFTLSYWSNMQLSGDSDKTVSGGEMNETDLILDYSFVASEQISLSVGNVLYALEGDDEDTNEAYLTLALNTLLSPSLTLYWDWDKSEADGLFYVLALGHDIQISEPLALSLSASAGYNQENYSVDESYTDWHNAEFGVGLDYALGEQLSLATSLIYSAPLSDAAEDSAGIDDEMSAGLSMTFSF